MEVQDHNNYLYFFLWIRILDMIEKINIYMLHFSLSCWLFHNLKVININTLFFKRKTLFSTINCSIIQNCIIFSMFLCKVWNIIIQYKTSMLSHFHLYFSLTHFKLFILNGDPYFKYIRLISMSIKPYKK